MFNWALAPGPLQKLLRYLHCYTDILEVAVWLKTASLCLSKPAGLNECLRKKLRNTIWTSKNQQKSIGKETLKAEGSKGKQIHSRNIWKGSNKQKWTVLENKAKQTNRETWMQMDLIAQICLRSSPGILHSPLAVETTVLAVLALPLEPLGILESCRTLE